MFITFVMSKIIFFFIIENWTIMKDLQEALKDNEIKILLKSNYYQEIMDLHSKVSMLNGANDMLSNENGKLNDSIKDSNKKNQGNNDLMITMGKQALRLMEINVNITRHALLKTPCLKPAHGKKNQTKILNKIRKFSSFNDIYEEKDISSSFKNMNSDLRV